MLDNKKMAKYLKSGKKAFKAEHDYSKDNKPALSKIAEGLTKAQADKMAKHSK